MRKLLWNAFWAGLIVLGLGTYLVHAEPCTDPIAYKIGVIDSGFGMSEGDFRSVVEEAANIWSEPLGKPLFVYDPKAKMSINLIFDTRQMTTLKNKELESAANKTKETADSVKEEYIALEDEYESIKNSYDASYAEFKKSQASYNSSVDYWNSRGGAPKDTYKKLRDEKARLERMDSLLDDKRAEVNDLANRINQRIKDYNDLIDEANANIHVINQSAGQEFDEGEYISDSSGKRINIYEFENKNELERVLAHEFGHALGLGHDSNPDSIMYYLNKSTNMELTAEDKEALFEVCQVK
jgi:hypothetical protein